MRSLGLADDRQPKLEKSALRPWKPLAVSKKDIPREHDFAHMAGSRSPTPQNARNQSFTNTSSILWPARLPSFKCLKTPSCQDSGRVVFDSCAFRSDSAITVVSSNLHMAGAVYDLFGLDPTKRFDSCLTGAWLRSA